jgi:signal transduction histidine kinase
MHDSYASDVAAISRIDAVDRILQVICRTTGLGFSAVARVTDKRWIACAVRDEISFGLKPGGELQLETTICNEIRDSGQAVIIDDASTDPVYCGHPTPKLYGFKSYISVPIRLPNGEFFGTLCAIDPRPARVNTPQTIEMFHLFADLIAMHLASQDRVAASEAALNAERTNAQLREQFIAVLGHDLRNPLSAISSATEVLRRLPQTPVAQEMLGIQKRSIGRMRDLIDNVLDFARSRLGKGLEISAKPDPELAAHLRQAVVELQTSMPNRTIELTLDLSRPVSCDSQRISQMLSNLVANALTHGDPVSPVQVVARHRDGAFEMSVTNRGETIPPHVVEQLFEPFSRGKVKRNQEGLGLGLYIATEIARAHGGTLAVDSRDGTTHFTFRMPAASDAHP